MVNVVLYGLVLCCLSCLGGCLWAGIPFKTKDYKEFVGAKIEVTLYPATIRYNPTAIADMPRIEGPSRDIFYSRSLGSVPSGTIITIHHVSRVDTGYGDINDNLIGAIEIPGYKGYVYVGTCDGKKHQHLNECISANKFRVIELTVSARE